MLGSPSLFFPVFLPNRKEKNLWARVDFWAQNFSSSVFSFLYQTRKNIIFSPVYLFSFSISLIFTPTKRSLNDLGSMAPLEFLVSLFSREDLLFIFPKNIKLFPWKIIYIYIYKFFFKPISYFFWWDVNFENMACLVILLIFSVMKICVWEL